MDNGGEDKEYEQSMYHSKLASSNLVSILSLRSQLDPFQHLDGSAAKQESQGKTNLDHFGKEVEQEIESGRHVKVRKGCRLCFSVLTRKRSTAKEG